MIRVIYTDNSTVDKEQDTPPTNEQLKEWMKCDFAELVKIFYEGKYEQMMVDETSALDDNRVINPAATRLYHENSRVHNRSIWVGAPGIYGTVVLLTGKHKYE